MKMKRRYRLALDQRHPRPHPDRRRAGLEETAAGKDDLHSGVPADRLAGREELERLRVLAAGRRVVLLPVGGYVRFRQPPAASPGEVPGGSPEARLNLFHALS